MNSGLNVKHIHIAMGVSYDGKIPTRAHSCGLRIKKFTKDSVFYTVYSIAVYQLYQPKQSAVIGAFRKCVSKRRNP